MRLHPLLLLVALGSSCHAWTPTRSVTPLRKSSVVRSPYSSSSCHGRRLWHTGLWQSDEASSSSESSDAVANSAVADEAVNIYRAQYGKRIESSGSPFPEEEIRSVVQEMIRVYGEDNALSMVRTFPRSVRFNPDYFGPSLDKFAEKFGREEAVQMLLRNPNLLAVKPTGYGSAESADDSVMILSYVMAYTRPIGGVLLAVLFGLLLIPVVKLTTGVDIREVIFSS